MMILYMVMAENKGVPAMTHIRLVKNWVGDLSAPILGIHHFEP